MCCDLCSLLLFFFFKQKTAYEMRISDWSSDVCSSESSRAAGRRRGDHRPPDRAGLLRVECRPIVMHRAAARACGRGRPPGPEPGDRLGPARYGQAAVRQRRQGLRGTCGRDRKSGVEGKRVTVRVDLGVGRNIKKKTLK